MDALLGRARKIRMNQKGVVLRLLLAEEGSKSLVELDQSLGRGAHFVLGHGGSLQNVA